MAADGQGDGSDAVLLDRDHLASDRELDIFATAYDAVFACGEGLELSRGGKDQRLTREAMMRYLQEHGDMVVSGR